MTTTVKHTVGECENRMWRVEQSMVQCACGRWYMGGGFDFLMFLAFWRRVLPNRHYGYMYEVGRAE